MLSVLNGSRRMRTTWIWFFGGSAPPSKPLTRISAPTPASASIARREFLGIVRQLLDLPRTQCLDLPVGGRRHERLGLRADGHLLGVPTDGQRGDGFGRLAGTHDDLDGDRSRTPGVPPPVDSRPAARRASPHPTRRSRARADPPAVSAPGLENTTVAPGSRPPCASLAMTIRCPLASRVS